MGVTTSHSPGRSPSPLSCPDDEDAGARLVDQSALLVDLMALDGVSGVDATGPAIEARAAGPLDEADAAAVRTSVEAVVRQHRSALGGAEPTVTVGGATGSPTSSARR